MFKEAPITTNSQEVETLIGPSVKLEGDFITEGNIIVEGIVCGSVKTSKNLRVGKDAKIFANVTADNALVAGEVQGNIKINGKLELTATAKIFGDIKTETLSVAAGSIINGKCQMGDAKNKSSKPDFSRQEKITLPEETEDDKKEDKTKKKV